LENSSRFVKNQKIVLEKARKIGLLLLDVDGVLTDGTILYDHKGKELKRFFVQDGQGIRWLQRSGVEVGFLSGRSSPAVIRRAGELGIDLLFQGIKNKIKCIEIIIRKTKFPPDQVAFMGDDFIDLPLLKRVGLSISVSNGHPLVQKEVDYITKAPGGYGAVREVCELILRAQNKWEAILREYGLRSG
jgi:3-deoxy-D-manno-octulosonate 8-phosphate phosphatase (KDO 8-P phosphatase)